MWSSTRLVLAKDLREWALANEDLMWIIRSNVNGSVAFFKADIDECKTDEALLEMLHKRLDVKQVRLE